MINVTITLTVLLLTSSVGAQSKAAINKVEDFFKDKTRLENPLDLRDPFKSPQTKSDGNQKGRGFVITSKGSYSNLATIPVRELSIQQLKVVGVLIGKERRALVHANENNKEVIILKEGMKIGPDEAELKAILPGGIVLVERIVNVYGQEEYLETVIPISR